MCTFVGQLYDESPSPPFLIQLSPTKIKGKNFMTVTTTFVILSLLFVRYKMLSKKCKNGFSIKRRHFLVRPQRGENRFPEVQKLGDRRQICELIMNAVSPFFVSFPRKKVKSERSALAANQISLIAYFLQSTTETGTRKKPFNMKCENAHWPTILFVK